MINSRIAGFNEAFERLEPCAVKAACTVLRGADSSNVVGLPDFAFVGTQVPLTFSDTEYFVDMLFYHLKLRSYIVCELKAVAFKPEHTGKLGFYLAAVDDQLRHPDDNKTIGLLLCQQKDKVIAEYALRNSSAPIGVAEYTLSKALPKELKTALPSIEAIEAELNAQDDGKNMDA